jgi:aspartyl-tRNA(Asn)/glutamyl-tRNA(Gln) amidotransferase subunit C
MSLTLQDVEHIAELAKLGLSAEEKERYRTQLSSILDYAQRLQRLPTDDIEATATVLPLTNVWRADEVQPCLSTADALANAPDAEDNHFRVRAVLEEE